MVLTASEADVALLRRMLRERNTSMRTERFYNVDSQTMAAIAPTREQQEALDLFLTQKTFRIDAYAGTGKTQTLRWMAERCYKRRGRYLVFGKDIASDAKAKLPKAVDCSTIHSYASGKVRAKHSYADGRLCSRAPTPRRISEFLGLPSHIVLTRSPSAVLSRDQFAKTVCDTVKNFAYSGDTRIATKHVPKCGKLKAIKDSEFNDAASMIVDEARKVWRDMTDPSGYLPLGHDGYLKIWALDCPRFDVDFLLVDEAQDTNAVVLEVFKKQSCQVVYVGDPYQQIYEWRGAVNALDDSTAPKGAHLTISHRFGPALAAAASKILSYLGAERSLQGSPELSSYVGPLFPDAILFRTNAGLLSELVQQLTRGCSCSVAGGTDNLRCLLEDVARLKEGKQAVCQEFFGFNNWNDVLAYCGEVQDLELMKLTKLVQQYGEVNLLGAIGRCRHDLPKARVFSTAHKAKGLWTGIVSESMKTSSPLSSE